MKTPDQTLLCKTRRVLDPLSAGSKTVLRVKMTPLRRWPQNSKTLALRPVSGERKQSSVCVSLPKLECCLGAPKQTWRQTIDCCVAATPNLHNDASRSIDQASQG